jgi:hypothetical protein
MGAATYELESSHVAMLSQPGLVTDVIRTAANAVEGIHGGGPGLASAKFLPARDARTPRVPRGWTAIGETRAWCWRAG